MVKLSLSIIDEHPTIAHENSLKSREFLWMGARVRGEADRFRLTPMGFSLSEPRLEIFFDFELFSSS